MVGPDFLASWYRLWSDGPMGVLPTGKRNRVGAVDVGDPCVGTPDGRVVPASSWPARSYPLARGRAGA